jgi:hypothetical protein
MNAAGWVGLVAAAYVAAVAAVVWRGGRLERVQPGRLVCPRFHVLVSCRLVQDVRLGRWISVESCSAFGPLTRALCRQECLGLRNGELRPLLQR